MRVRIKSNGTPEGTEVMVLDDAYPFPVEHQLANVTDVDWRIRVGKSAEARITLRDVEIDAEAVEGTIERPHAQLRRDVGGQDDGG